MTNRAAYIATIKFQLDELNTSVTQLESRAEAAQAEVRATYQEEIAKLRRQSNLAMAKLEEIKACTEAGWESTVTEMEKVRNAFVNAFGYFKSHI